LMFHKSTRCDGLHDTTSLLQSQDNSRRYTHAVFMSTQPVELLPLLVRVLEAQKAGGWSPFRFLTGLSGGDLFVVANGVELLLDLAHDEIAPDMGLRENDYTRALTSNEGYSRAFHTSLFAGARKASIGGIDALVFGIGLRRWTKVWPLHL